MSDHAAVRLLLGSADNSTAFESDFASNETTLSSTSTTILPNSSTAVPTTVPIKTTVVSSTLSPLTTTTRPPADSHFLFAFCTILFLVAIALIVKIVYSNRKKYRNLAPNMPSWRLSASRTSGFAPAGFVQNATPRGSRGSSGFGSAHYTAVPPSTNARLATQQQPDAFVGDRSAQLEWERQFFDEDPADQENRVGSRLELRR